MNCRTHALCNMVKCAAMPLERIAACKLRDVCVWLAPMASDTATELYN